MDELLRFVEQHPALFVGAGAVVSAICAVAGVLISWYKLKKGRNELQEEVGQLKHELGQLQERNKALEEGEAKTREENSAVRVELFEAEERARGKQEELTKELEAKAERIVEIESKAERDGKLIRQMLQLEGCFWKKRLQSGAPRFRLLDGRKAAVISVLNLKGGVGKTTIAAHLAAAFAGSGYRPLLVDIDLQGSLSSMFIPLDKLAERSKEERLLQHFLSHAAHHRKMNLLEYITPILDNRGGLVATTDKMAYAELNLTMHWLLRLGKRDTRFLLRRALHQRRITGNFDVILLDCPPLINTCCVNALAASDYVLVPVMPSRKSAERVPQLLRTLRDLSGRINPCIQPLGMVLNRTYGNKLTGVEQDVWKQAQVHAHEQWGSPVYACKTHIRQSTEVRTGETEFTAPEAGSELHDTFKRLVLELEERLPRECRRSATASV